VTAIVPPSPVITRPSTSARRISVGLAGPRVSAVDVPAARTALWTFDREAPVVTGFADVGGATSALVAVVLVWSGHGRLASLALLASLVAL
jgi:hypothetical protein